MNTLYNLFFLHCIAIFSRLLIQKYITKIILGLQGICVILSLALFSKIKENFSIEFTYDWFNLEPYAYLLISLLMLLQYYL